MTDHQFIVCGACWNIGRFAPQHSWTRHVEADEHQTRTWWTCDWGHLAAEMVSIDDGQLDVGIVNHSPWHEPGGKLDVGIDVGRGYDGEFARNDIVFFQEEWTSLRPPNAVRPVDNSPEGEQQ